MYGRESRLFDDAGPLVIVPIFDYGGVDVGGGHLVLKCHRKLDEQAIVRHARPVVKVHGNERGGELDEAEPGRAQE